MDLKILLHFGLEHQLEKLKEEVNELIEAIEENDREHIIEETADVQNVLNQFKALYEITDYHLVPVMEFKRERTFNKYGIEKGETND